MARYRRLARLASFACLGFALLVNVFTLGLLASDGRVEGILRFYVWSVDAGALLAALALNLPKGRARGAALAILYALVILGSVELAAAAAYRATRGSWHFRRGDWRDAGFVPHARLIGAPRPGWRGAEGGVAISHNGLGLRGGAADLAKPGELVRILAIGGSSTYGVGVSDADAWPSQLAARLGPGHEVLNLGVPGYTSAEHVIQTAFLLDEFKPDVALFYVGWNDLHTLFVEGVRADYSDYHADTERATLQLPPVWRGPNLAAAQMGTAALQRAGWLPAEPGAAPPPVESENDWRALELYARNLRTIAAIARGRGVRAVFVPQVLNYAILTGEGNYGWIPFVADRDIQGVMEKFNARMREVAEAEGIPFAGEILSVEWKREDFVDEGHFSAAGGGKFAETLKPRIAGLASSGR